MFYLFVIEKRFRVAISFDLGSVRTARDGSALENQENQLENTEKNESRAIPRSKVMAQFSLLVSQRFIESKKLKRPALARTARTHGAEAVA